MATVNFSIPDEIKEEFLRVFAHENRSAVVARLMQQGRGHSSQGAVSGAARRTPRKGG